MAKVTMPQLGESVAEGTIGKWFKQPGDSVAKYEPLLEVITDKVNAEVPSPFAGVLKEILAEEGATVPNNAEIAIIETADEAGNGAAEAPAGGSARRGAKRLPRLSPRRPAEAAAGPTGSDERPVTAGSTSARVGRTPAPRQRPRRPQQLRPRPRRRRKHAAMPMRG